MVEPNVEVLLVEDNEDHVFLTKKVLLEAQNARYNISVVTDGEAALDFIYQRGKYSNVSRPDLILLDIKLPKIDGLEVLKRLKLDPSTKSIPILMLTSSEREQDVAISYQNGINSYITKPINYEDFEQKLRAIQAYWDKVSKLPPKTP
ncbi:MAG: two-component system response regulator [Dehalococcoidia bacterium]|nr:two-component system response regulator [Dehalococcoidia bacterium]